MIGAQESLFHCEVHSCCLEQIPEHHPQLMKRGAVKHAEHVIKCAHPGPAEGTLNIYMREEIKRTSGKSQIEKKKRINEEMVYLV